MDEEFNNRVIQNFLDLFVEPEIKHWQSPDDHDQKAGHVMLLNLGGTPQKSAAPLNSNVGPHVSRSERGMQLTAFRPVRWGRSTCVAARIIYQSVVLQEEPQI